MSGRWFDSSRQIFWDNPQQDLTIPGSFKGTSGTFDTLYTPELYTNTQVNGGAIGANLTAVPSITPGGNWISIAMSASGQYQSAIDQGVNIWLSSDYGITWAVSPGSPSPVDFYDIAVSASGQYQSVVAQFDYIYVSSDYGRTWTQVNQSVGIATYSSIDVSASGQYQTAIAINKPIYISSDYGITWTPVDSQRGWYDVAVSASGQYQTANADDSVGVVYTSSNYGKTWTSVSVNAGLTNRLVAMSATGQYQIVNADNANNIYLSSDYGMSWNPVASALTWSQITMSASGQYMIAYDYITSYLWISTDYGNTWNTNSVGIGLTNMAISDAADYFTTVTYGGTVYTSITPVILPNVQIGVGTISSIVIPVLGLSSITTDFISSGVITTGNLSTLTANMSSAIITNLRGASTIVSTLTGNALSISSLRGNTLFASSATISTLTGNAVSISSLTGNALFTSTATISTLTGASLVMSSLRGNAVSASTATVSTLTGNLLSMSSLVGNTLFASTATVSTLIGNALSISSLTGNALSISSLTGNALSISSLTGNALFASTVTVSTLTGNALSMSSLRGNTVSASTATVSTLTGNALSMSSLVGNTLFASTATFSTLTGNALSMSSLVGNALFASTATISTLTGASLVMSSLRGNAVFASTATVSTLTGNALSMSSLVGNTFFASTATFSTLNTALGSFSNLAVANNFFSWQTTTTGDSLVTGTVSNFNVGSGNFTMECFFYPTATPANWGTILSLGTTATQGHEFRITQRNGSAGLGFLYPTSATTDGNMSLLATSTLSLNTWCHLALIRSTNWMHLYSNGTAVLSTNLVSHSYNENKRLFLYNNPYNDDRGQGYINSARVVVGQALYTGNFIPPTQQLSTSRVGAYGINVATTLTGTVAFLGGTVSTLTDAGPSALALTVSGSPRSGTTVPTTFTGRIGINCNSPQFGLDVNGATNINGNLLLGRGANAPIIANGYTAIGLTGGNSFGYMYGAYESLADGMHVSYNYVNSNVGTAPSYATPDTRGYIPNAGGGTSQISVQYGQIQFKTGTTNTAPSTLMTLTTTGLGINCNSPSKMLDVNGTATISPPFNNILINATTQQILLANDSPTTAPYLFAQSVSAAPARIRIGGYSNATAMPISLNENGGNIGIGTTNPGAQLDLSTDSARKLTTTTWTTGSDQRIKKNISSANLELCYSTLKQIDLKYFEWDRSIPQLSTVQDRHSLGFIAQEIKPIFPNAVTFDSNMGLSDFHSLNIDQVYKMHYGATKKLMELVEQQGSTIQGMQQQLSTLTRI